MTKLETRMTNGEAPHPIPLLGEERGREATVRREQGNDEARIPNDD
jgi:hypothetical protein